MESRLALSIFKYGKRTDKIRPQGRRKRVGTLLRSDGAVLLVLAAGAVPGAVTAGRLRDANGRLEFSTAEPKGWTTVGAPTPPGATARLVRAIRAVPPTVAHEEPAYAFPTGFALKKYNIISLTLTQLRVSVIMATFGYLGHWYLVGSLYAESKDHTNPSLIGPRILGFHGVTNGNKDSIFTDCNGYKLEWAGELGLRQGTNGI